MAALVRRIEGRPTASLSLGAALLFLATIVGILHLTAMSAATFRVEPAGEGSFTVIDSTGAMSVQADGAARFTDASGAVRLAMPLSEMVAAYEPSGSSDAIRGYYDRRDRAASLLREEGMRLRLPDGRLVNAGVERGGWTVLSPEIVVILLSGLGSALAGLWVFVLRPREEATRAFALSGVAYGLATYTIAWLLTETPARSGGASLFWQATNYVACLVIGMELIRLFARYPTPILPRRLFTIAYALFAATLTWAFLAIWPNLYARLAVAFLVVALLIVGLILAQIWLARKDPVHRAVMGWVGSTLVMIIALTLIAHTVPQMLGRPLPIPVGVVNLSFLLFFLALGFAVARYRLFDLGDWTTRVLRTLAILLVVLSIDAAIALLLGQSWTFSLFLFIAAMLWMPVRAWMLRKRHGARDRDTIALLKGANQVAFASTPRLQAQRWATLLAEQFQPLEVREGSGQKVRLNSDGRELVIPSPVGPGALTLCFAGGGGRLFNSGDVAMAEAMVALVSEVIEARRAYDRGAEAERGRIARDLHDDVGARLMTSLHRPDVGGMQADVRLAMAEMRLIIDGLSGQSRFLADVLADLRHETVTRLALAGIRTDWPMAGEIAEDTTIDHARNRTLWSVVRELTTNTLRHSGAALVTVAFVAEDNGALALSFADDGGGLSRPLADAMGNGLGNARKRVEEVGGSLSVESRPGEGLRIHITLPPPSQEQGMEHTPHHRYAGPTSGSDA